MLKSSVKLLAHIVGGNVFTLNATASNVHRSTAIVSSLQRRYVGDCGRQLTQQEKDEKKWKIVQTEVKL